MKGTSWPRLTASVDCVPAATLVTCRSDPVEPTDTTLARPLSFALLPRATELVPVLVAPEPTAVLLVPLATGATYALGLPVTHLFALWFSWLTLTASVPAMPGATLRISVPPLVPFRVMVLCVESSYCTALTVAAAVTARSWLTFTASVSCARRDTRHAPVADVDSPVAVPPTR